MIVLMSAFLLLSAFSCGGGNKANSTSEQSEETAVNVPQFDADSAYLYVKNQVDFGPRVPNTKEHVACGNYLAGQLEAFGAQVTNQYADLIAYDGTLLKARNIIGSYKPESKKRIALFAHWDTRPWADNDPDEKNHNTPILGANDGASGVGALLEIARLVNQQQPELGIDIILLDAEDYGAPQFYTGQHKEEFWCLGSQYWARNPHVQGYNARFGILLDMVGGEGSVFMKEGYSEEFAPDIKSGKRRRRLATGRRSWMVTEDLLPTTICSLIAWHVLKQSILFHIIRRVTLLRHGIPSMTIWSI